GDVDPLLVSDACGGGLGGGEHGGQRGGVEVALVEGHRRLADDGGDDAGLGDDGPNGGDAAVLHRDVAGGQVQTRDAAERVAAVRHRRGAGVGGLAGERDRVALDAERAKDDAHREV